MIRRAVFLLVGMLMLLLTSVPSIAQSGSVSPALPIDAAEFQKVLQRHRGKVLVVNFWATWCVPCLREVPDLLALQAEHATQGVLLIGVAVDEPSPQAVEVERFRARYFPQFLTYARKGPDIDELAAVIDPAWNEVVPTTYIIGRDGKVKQRIQGKRTLEQFRLALQTAL